MNKTLLYRLFKAGAIPKDARSQIHKEGVVLSDEGIAGSVTFRNFRAPGRYSSWRRNWFSGSIVLTRKHFLAFSWSKPIIGVAWDDQRIKALNCSLEKKQILYIAFDASTFNEDWSGDVEIRFSTRLARSFLEAIKRKTPERPGSKGAISNRVN
jgi:hypothetical protein